MTADLTAHEERLQFETLLADLSARFVGVRAGELDREIENVLAQICEALDLDRGTLFQYTSPDGELVFSHSWARGVFERVPMLPVSAILPWSTRYVRDGRILQFTSLDELPAEAAVDKVEFARFGTKSGIAFPLVVAGQHVGAVTFSALKAERRWPPILVSRLRLVADILANAIARAHADEAVREAEQRLNLALAAAGAGAWSMDIATELVWVSPRQRELFQFDGEETITYDNFARAIHEDDRPAVRAAVDEAIRSNTPLYVEFRIVLRDGRIRWIAARGRRQGTLAGKPERLIGISTDVTDRKVGEEALRASELRLASAIEVAGLGFYEERGPMGDRVTFLDKRAQALLGIDADRPEAVTAAWLSHVDPLDQPSLVQVSRTFENGGPEHAATEYRYVHPQRGRIWIRHAVRALARDAEGRSIHAVGVLQDITERHMAEEALRESESLNRVTFEQAAVGIAHVAIDGRWLRVNDKLCSILGYSREELLRLTFQEVTHPDDVPADLEYRRRLIAGHSNLRSIEKRYIRKDGRIVFVNLTVSLVRSPSGEPQHFISVIEDITERKRAEEAFERERVQTVSVINSTDDVIWAVEPKRFGLMTWNSAVVDYFARTYGIEVRAGMTPEELLPAGEAARWRAFFSAAVAEGSLKTEMVIPGENKVVLFSMFALQRAGEVFGVSVFGKDITARKREEENARRHMQDLAHLSRVATIGELTSSLAHELHQPLSAILLNAETAKILLAADHPELDELRTIVSEIHEDDRRAGEVIHRLRALLKRRSLQPQPVDLAVMVDEIVSIVRSVASEHDIVLDIAVPPGAFQVMADRVHVQQVLLNLITNAIDAMSGSPPGRERRLSIRAEAVAPALVELEVRDSGPGIPQETLGRIFDPFFTTKSDGMGMGLSISKSIVEAHGGSLRAASPNEAGGATFTFTLRLAK